MSRNLDAGKPAHGPGHEHRPPAAGTYGTGRNSTELRPATAAAPCAVCGKPAGCSRGVDGLLVCRGAAGPVPGFVHLGHSPKDAQWSLYRREGDPALAPRAAHRPPPPATDWGAKARELRAALTADRSAALAAALGLPADAPAALPLLGWGRDRGGGFFSFPELDAVGRVVGINRRYADGSKKVMANGRRGLTLPAGWADRPGPVLVVEGASDTLALAAVGLCGVGRPSNTGGADLLAGLFRDWPADRDIVVLGEHDAKPDGRWPGRDGAVQVAAALARHLGRAVAWALPPPGAKDVRGWLVGRDVAGADAAGRAALGAELLDHVAANATAVTPAAPPAEPLEKDNDPHRLARVYRDAAAAHPDGLTLRYWRSVWWRWDGAAYRELPPAELRADVVRVVKDELDRRNVEALAAHQPGSPGPPPTAVPVTSALVTNVVENLAALAVLPAAVEAPAWLGDRPGRREYVATASGLIDVAALLAGDNRPLRPPSPLWFATAAVPYPFDPAADCPRWRAAVATCLEGDPDRVALLRQWCGYCLLPDTSMQKFLLLEGEGGNGKSVVCAALTALLGPANVSAVPLESFGQRFGLTPTLGKLANVVAEVGEIDRVAEGVLKSAVSGDRMAFDRKNLPVVEATPTARMVFATNNPPRFGDRSGGLWRRLLLLPFRVQIPESAQVRGMDQPAWWLASGEMPGLLNWALAGLRDLRARGRFAGAAVCEEAVARYRGESNPALAYLTEHCSASDQGEVASAELYEAYRDWCEKNGYRPLSERPFGKEVARAFPGTRRVRRGPRACRFWAYEGLSCEAEADAV